MSDVSVSEELDDQVGFRRALLVTRLRHAVSRRHGRGRGCCRCQSGRDLACRMHLSLRAVGRGRDRGDVSGIGRGFGSPDNLIGVQGQVQESS